MYLGILNVIAIMIVVISFAESRKCPNIPTVTNLDLQRISGHWYAIYESSPPRLPCLNYNVTTDNQSLGVNFLPYGVEVTSTRTDSVEIGKGFKVHASLPFINDASWNIFATDYETYAGNFVCKETAPNYYSVTLWSRTPTLSDSAKTFLKGILDSYNVDHSTLEPMEQRTSFCSSTERVLQGGKDEIAALSKKN